MNSRMKKGVVWIVLICTVTFFGASHYRILPFASSPTPDTTPLPHTGVEPSILSLDITYTGEDNTFDYRFYRIEIVRDTYYSNTGKRVDPDLISYLTLSFTDFYRSDYQDSYKDFFRYDYSPHFSVVVTLANHKKMVLESDSGYHCFIPWNIEYEGACYVQYNGKIPTALLKILIEIDKEYWSKYKKEAQFGCYPAAVPQTYENRKSHLFSKTEPEISFEIEKGRTHTLWQANADVVAVAYSQGRVYVTSPHKIMCMEAETGTLLWDHTFEENPLSVKEAQKVQNVAVFKDSVYVGVNSSVYSIDTDTGEVVWSYETPAAHRFSLAVVENVLIALTGGVTCLDLKTGELIWEISDDTWNEVVYEDKLLVSGIGEDNESYYALLDTASGEVLWKEPLFRIQHPVYHKGVLYFFSTAESALGSLVLETGEENWFHTDKSVRVLRIFGDSIFLIVTDNKTEETTLLILSTKGLRTFKYTYPEDTEWKFNHVTFVEMTENRIYVAREGGIVEMFDLEDERIQWKTELRGIHITRCILYGKGLYTSADDGRVYCLDADTGDIVWMITALEELAVFPEKAHVEISNIEDGLILVITEEGTLHVLSVEEN